jgi:ribose transport system ATP-binding protein
MNSLPTLLQTPNGYRPALDASRLSKTYLGSAALSSVSLSIAPGEIHGLVGENGSGKSTFIKIVAGYLRPDSGGSVLIDGRLVPLGSTTASYKLGCRVVHQDLGLVDSSSILDNICLSSGFSCRLGTIRRRFMQRRATEDLARVGLDLDPTMPVRQLTPALKTGVALARALRPDVHSEVKLLVLDEPTATLAAQEVNQLLDMVRMAAARGVGVLYVTHRLDEVFDVATNVTVLRDGYRVATEPVSSLNRRRLIRLLVGNELDETRARSAVVHADPGDPILSVQDFNAPPLTAISFTASRGEIIGLAGITGSGRETILGAMFGATPRQGGTVELDGALVPPSRPAASIRAGMAFLPADRKTLGGIMDLSARENLSLANVKAFWRAPLLRRTLENNEARFWFQMLSVRPADNVESKLATFSGGNQQKILVAKWLRLVPRVLLLDEPTQGVDVGAKMELHHQLLATAQQGATIVISSSDVDELAAICHRVLVLRDGRIIATLEGDDLSAANISTKALLPQRV